MQDITSDLLKDAISAHKEGNFSEAEDLYRQILTLSPDNIEVSHYLALLCISTEQYQIAVTLLTKAVSIKGDNPDILYNLALAHQKAGDINTAIHYYKLVIALNPDYALAYNNIGVAYQQFGDLKQANFFLEKAFTITPDYADAYYNFSQSYKFNAQDKIYANKIEQLLINKNKSINDEIKLNFSLGKIYDDLSNYENAFKYYNKANNLKNHGFNIDQFQNYIDQLIAQYTPPIIQDLQIATQISSHKRFIFIVGMPRSGSTLIEQILANHPDVHSAGEAGFIGDIVDDLPGIIQSDKPYPACVHAMRPDDIAQLSNKLQHLVDNLQTPSNIILDKSPINFLHIGLIILLFPNSKVVLSNRNSVDTCLSCFFQNFDRQHQYSYELKNLALFHNEYSRLMNHWKTLFPGKINETSYENMVENQLSESKKLLTACELDWNENCLNFHKSDRIVQTASKWQVRQPIYKTSVNKWRNYEAYIGDLINNLKH